MLKQKNLVMRLLLLSTILLGASHACVDIHSEAEVRTVSDIDPYTFPDTLAYLDSVNGSVKRVFKGLTRTDQVLYVDLPLSVWDERATRKAHAPSYWNEYRRHLQRRPRCADSIPPKR